jgi:hypothetical protein
MLKKGASLITHIDVDEFSISKERVGCIYVDCLMNEGI